MKGLGAISLDKNANVASSTVLSEKLTDPTYTGPGTWNLMHQEAHQARTIEAQKQAVQNTRFKIDNFNCPVCRAEGQKYMQAHPPEQSIGNKIKLDGQVLFLGVFMWTWRFHNSVNERLSKPLLSLETAHNIYSIKSTDNAGTCSSVCMAAEPVPKDDPPAPGTIIEQYPAQVVQQKTTPETAPIIETL